MKHCCYKWVGQTVYMYKYTKHGWNECSTKAKHCPECGFKLPEKKEVINEKTC